MLYSPISTSIIVLELIIVNSGIGLHGCCHGSIALCVIEWRSQDVSTLYGDQLNSSAGGELVFGFQQCLLVCLLLAWSFVLRVHAGCSR